MIINKLANLIFFHTYFSFLAKCPDLSDPDSGTLTVTTTGSVTTATFTCQTGYYLSGDFTLTCGSDGSWSSDVPTCSESL